MEAWEEGRPLEAVGRGTFEVVATVAGTKGLDKIAKGSKATTAVTKLDDVAEAASATAKTTTKVDDAAKASTKVDAVAPKAAKAEVPEAKKVEAREVPKADAPEAPMSKATKAEGDPGKGAATAERPMAAKGEAELHVAEVEVRPVPAPTATVWDLIKATQPARPGTAIPKSFEVMAGSDLFWVHPNATKHMAEYITRNGPSHGMPMNSQAMLTSFQASVEEVVKGGVPYGELVSMGRWELMFSPGRAGDALPVIKHALYR